jgi:DNA-binding response OmpR family regulator
MTEAAAATNARQGVSTETSGRALVLLVDDCEDTRDMFAEYLSQAFDVAVASDATSALARAEELRPAAIVLDWSLPDMRGDEVTARLRERVETRTTPIVIVSGFEEPRTMGPAPWDAYFTKPCRPDVLLRRLRELSGATARA